jgi:FtsZ-binding cell division protein ZapB
MGFKPWCAMKVTVVGHFAQSNGLDNETIVEQFGKIEEKIESLIKTNQLLKAANLELKEKAENLETELQQKKNWRTEMMKLKN